MAIDMEINSMDDVMAFMDMQEAKGEKPGYDKAQPKKGYTKKQYVVPEELQPYVLEEIDDERYDPETSEFVTIYDSLTATYLKMKGVEREHIGIRKGKVTSYFRRTEQLAEALKQFNEDPIWKEFKSTYGSISLEKSFYRKAKVGKTPSDYK